VSRPVLAGIDLGGTKAHLAVADSEATVLAEGFLPTAGVLPLATRIAEGLDALAGAAGGEVSDLRAVGVGGAGVPNGTGAGFRLAPNLGAADGAPDTLADELRALLPAASVVLENDVNAAALGELHHGLGRAHHSFVVLAVGTGVGAGIVVDGTILRGAHGAAGEVGFLPLGTDPLEPANQVRGPLEEQLAGDALTRRYDRLAGEELSTAEVFDRLGTDPHADAAVDEHGRWLAHGLAAIAALIDPGAVVLTGGIGSRPELLAVVRRWLDQLGHPGLDLQISPLGSRAAVLGALHLARDAAQAAQEGQLR
jgi:glucokinase